ncbi:glycosyl hydrolase family 95 catalytic domain-containing protein [Alkalihalobacillus trypoxylicola]|uniref:Alpha-L-fucosidase n=1 Tax=Alkalihalobacillus trypoxylicola TaxID=519424 RepID=A0A162EE75_9BACI|nr:glycoside hydrolase family 95 protein [Alkalihalobacillus trypoxylicola]KYG32363.1 alpha-L-fucosidase [Alkalihalobacillus trypoxylicola]
MSHLLSYKNEANDWNEALPIGNGRLGGMIYGKVKNEQIQLNEDSVWYGGPRDRNNRDALKYLSDVQNLLNEGKLKEAEDLALLSMSGTPFSQSHYEPLGDLFLQFEDHQHMYSNYKRKLDLESGMVHITYEMNGICYEREIFASYPDQVMIIRLHASKSKSLSFKAFLDRGKGRNFDYLEAVNEHQIMMSGRTGGEKGIAFCSILQAEANNGSVSTVGNRLVVKEADSVTLMLTAATTFRYNEPLEQCLKTLTKAAGYHYEDRMKRHIDDYQSLYNRIQFHLEDKEALNEPLATDERLENVKAGKRDLSLLSTYFHFGRYLLISSSRPNSLPATLQGIWNQHMLPPWDSKYTININTEMNYWPAEACQLGECHQPLFDLIERLNPNGQITAEKMYGCRGFVAHHNTDIWADSAPQDMYMPATIWPLGAAWLCLHIWEHYEYTLDSEFLEKYYYLLKESSLFFVDFLQEDESGNLITSPSVSPENTYILPNGEKGTLCIGPSMDSQIIYSLFTAVIEAGDVLKNDTAYQKELMELRSKLPSPQIGKHGQIMEWLEDYEEAEPGHRHISQLFALHPGNQISPSQTPELAEAAKTTLERRLQFGGGHTGWSRAWIINMWARLEDGEKASENLQQLLAQSTLPNLFDNHPPFQIDGNFGGTAGIIEMLIQSHLNEIHLLPAIPKEWHSGYVKGLRTKGGFEIEMEWKEHRLTKVFIHSLKGNTCHLRYKSKIQVLNSNKPIEVKVNSIETFAFETVENEVYEVKIL